VISPPMDVFRFVPCCFPPLREPALILSWEMIRLAVSFHAVSLYLMVPLFSPRPFFAPMQSSSDVIYPLEISVLFFGLFFSFVDFLFFRRSYSALVRESVTHPLWMVFVSVSYLPLQCFCCRFHSNPPPSPKSPKRSFSSGKFTI